MSNPNPQWLKKLAVWQLTSTTIPRTFSLKGKTAADAVKLLNIVVLFLLNTVALVLLNVVVIFLLYQLVNNSYQ